MFVKFVLQVDFMCNQYSVKALSQVSLQQITQHLKSYLNPKHDLTYYHSEKALKFL